MAGPVRFLRRKPNKQSIRFAGRYVNLARLADHEGLDHSHVWRVVTGARPASIAYAQRIARGMGMSLDEFLEAVALFREERLQQKSA